MGRIMVNLYSLNFMSQHDLNPTRDIKASVGNFLHDL
jgi:hypothetical protein